MSQTDTQADPQTHETVVTLTEEAQEAARRFLAERPDVEGAVLRVGVLAGGCNGFSYAVSVDVKKDGDVVHAYEGFECVVDQVSKDLIQGTVVGYENTIGHAGFTFENPLAKTNCGCGTSFDVE
jgi:iron-sulfur cluster assembly accessory protein